MVREPTVWSSPSPDTISTWGPKEFTCLSMIQPIRRRKPPVGSRAPGMTLGFSMEAINHPIARAVGEKPGHRAAETSGEEGAAELTIPRSNPTLRENEQIA
ncbi:MAG TPA: hypothetical protein DEO85_08790 [Maritimibacter sp.]|nr:hypothetical protein [Maritimibacter sp.]